MNKYLRMVLVLIIISMFSGGVLALSYGITNPIILEQEKQAQERAVLRVIPGAVNIEMIEKEGISFFIGKDDQGEKKGIAFKAQGIGFDGPIDIMVGYNPKEGKLLGIDILSMTETPGLGSRVAEEAFKNQFLGKSVEDSFTVKEDVEIVTGATISSRGVAEGIKSTLNQVLEIFPVGGDIL